MSTLSPMLVTTPLVLDLFSGAGGTGLGFKNAGFHIIGAVEKNPHAAKTYHKNLGVDVLIGDICAWTPESLRKWFGVEPRALDVLVGCPPCQGFSRMRNNAGIGDKKNDLVLLYLDFVKEFQPRFAVFENVPGLIRTTHGKDFFNKLCNGLRELKYELIHNIVEAADFGTAQRRKRVIVIAGRDGEVPPFPEPTHANPASREVRLQEREPWRTVEDCIGKNAYPVLAAGENGEQQGTYPNHIAPAMSAAVLEFIKQVPVDGGSRRDVPSHLWLACHRNHTGHKDVYGRLAWGKPAGTITTGCTNVSKGRFVHPTQHRSITSREAAALQGFPDTFVFHGQCLGMQIGNAVPPPLAFAIATALKQRLLRA